MRTYRGRVVKGARVGRKLGFPTANISLKKHPPRGVWMVLVSGTTLRERVGACNVGVRPTIGGLKLVTEVHIPRFHGNLYGRTLTLKLLKKIRAEKKFPSIGALRAQIRRDVAAVMLK